MSKRADAGTIRASIREKFYGNPHYRVDTIQPLVSILSQMNPVPIYLWFYSPCGSSPLFQFLNLYTVGRTLWAGDQPVARLLPTRRIIQTE
jgi:hypothetical protein